MGGPINKVPLTNETYFEFQLDGFKLGSKQYVSGNTARAICDSGTSLIAGPMSVMDDLNTKLGAIPSPTGAAIFPSCPNATHPLPDVTITVGGIDYSDFGRLRHEGDCSRRNRLPQRLHGHLAPGSPRHPVLHSRRRLYPPVPGHL